MSKGDLASLHRDAQEIGNTLRELSEDKKRLLIITHFDADGLCAGGIISEFLLRQGALIHVKVVKELTPQLLQNISKLEYDAVIFSEIGSGYTSAILENDFRNDIFILDHHPPEKIEAKNITHLNPNIYGFDGAREISGAGVNYLVAKVIDSNIDLSILAVIGALGDMQDRNDQRALISLNAGIVNDAVKWGNLKTEKGLLFYGRETRPIHKAIASTTSPFLPGLSGREDRCLALLSSIGISVKINGRWRTISDLVAKEEQSLVTKIVEYLNSEGVQYDIVQELIGEIYTLLGESKGSMLRDGREYSSVLNACGRMGKGGLGLSICLGDRGVALTESDILVKEYRKTLAKCIEWLEKEGRPQITESLYIVRGEEFIPENLSGAVSSMLTSSSVEHNKAIIVITKDNGEAKISARANPLLLEKGVHLGSILHTLSKEFDGFGGGHDIAAGARIPMEKLEDFLQELNSEMKKVETT